MNPDSTTETFAAAKLCVHNWRWKDVPFYVRTGKRLAAKKTEIAIVFKQVPYSLFASMGLDEIPRNASGKFVKRALQESLSPTDAA